MKPSQRHDVGYSIERDLDKERIHASPRPEKLLSDRWLVELAPFFDKEMR